LRTFLRFWTLLLFACLCCAEQSLYGQAPAASAPFTLSDRYNGHYLAEAKDVLSIAQYAYQHGGIALIDYLNALQDDRNTTLNALDAYAQTWMAIHQLSYTTASAVVP
jgi:hypothetical protein